MVKRNSHKKLSRKSKNNNNNNNNNTNNINNNNNSNYLKGGNASKPIQGHSPRSVKHRGGAPKIVSAENYSKAKNIRGQTPYIKDIEQMGGSPASDLVNQASKSPAVVNDFVTSPRVRDGPTADTYSGQCGGSDASKMVMSQLGNEYITKSYPTGYNVKGNMKSLNLYQTTGGTRKNHKTCGDRKNKSKSKSRKHKNNKSRKNMRGGGSDWISSQYSLGSYNGPEMSAGDVAKFSHSQAGTRADYMTPPNLGSAGSGHGMGPLEGANVRMTGSPLV
jgi:hypothetical protein